MKSLPFEEVFGFGSKPEIECSQFSIDIPCPSLQESSELYQKLKDICAEPHAIIDLLNIQIMNHVRSGNPDHYTTFELSQMLNPFFSILPYILSDRCIIEQAHQIQINVKNFLSSWQYFSFQCFYTYFSQILSSKIYIGESRKWLIKTIFDLLSQNKSIYSSSIVTRVHLKDKQFKDKTNLHAVIHYNQTISIYCQNVCIKKGILKYEPDSEFPTHQLIENTNIKDTPAKSRVVILEPNGEKITSDSADQFFREGYQLNHLIWSCMSCKTNEFSLEAIDSISRMIFGFKGSFLQILYYSKPIEGLWESLITASVFIHRHTFVLKTLIWAIFDEAVEKNKLFKSSFPAVHYLISFVKYISKPQIIYLDQQIINCIDIYENSIENVSSVFNPLEDDDFKHQIVKVFWDSLLEAAQTFPKSMYDICFQLLICSDLYSKEANRNRFSQVNDFLFGEIIIPNLIDNLRSCKKKVYRDSFNFITKTVTMTTANNSQNEYSQLGFKPLQTFLEFVSQDASQLNVKDIDTPPLQDYINSVYNLIDCIKGSADYIRNCFPMRDLNFTSPSSFVEVPDENDESHAQLPVLRRTRSLRIQPITSVIMKDNDRCVNHLRPFKEIPKDIFPWKSRIAKDIFYSYYAHLNQNQ